ncbi:MAG: radical SAM protein [Lachnospiraceae bacterium]|nr:radical SAM protein [Lachnospiraceae bacterium]
MRYAVLNEALALKGYRGLPHALVDRKTGVAEPLNRRDFFLFNICDGTIDLDVIMLSEEQRKRLDELKQQNLITYLETAVPVDKARRYRRTDNYYIRSVHWSVTGRCNLNCRHCYMSAPDQKYRDLTREECFRVIRQFYEANVQTVSITGGEPFVRTDLFQILDYINQMGMEVSQIYTNGTLLNKEKLRWFIQRKHTPQFVLSFDGIGSHDWIRGQKGAQEQAILAIRLLKAEGFSVMIETALCRRNIDSLLDTYRLLRELGVDCWKTSMIFSAGEWKEQREKELKQEDLYDAYLKLIREYTCEDAPMDLQLDGFFACPRHHPKQWFSPYRRKEYEGKGEYSLSCGTCRVHPYLLPDGTLLPCATMTDSKAEPWMPNLLREPLNEIYRNLSHPFFGIANMRVSEIVGSNKDCCVCAHRRVCGGGCRAMSYLEKKGLMGHSDILCLFFNGGYELQIEQTVNLAVQGTQSGKGGKKMGSKEALKKVLEEQPEAMEKLNKITELPKEERKKALLDFAEEYRIELKEEDFTQESGELTEQELGKVAGGNDIVDAIGVFTGIWGVFPPSTGRGTTNGTKRFKK